MNDLMIKQKANCINTYLMMSMMPFGPLYNSINFKVSKHKIRQKEFVKANSDSGRRGS